MKCKEPTKKYPNGRTGTNAGIHAHRQAGEERCEECAKFQSEYNRAYREANAEKKRENDRRWREKNLERKRENDRRYYQENSEKIKQRARDWHHNNKEYANARSKAWREANPEQARESVRRWHEENAEYLKERSAEWREKNRAYMRDYLRQYYVENRGKWEGYGRKRRSLERSLPQESYSIEDIVAHHGEICYLCLHEVDPEREPWNSDSPHVDHVHPLSVEGCPGDVLENVRLTHAVCNIRKGARLVEDLTLPFVAPVGDEWDLLQ